MMCRRLLLLVLMLAASLLAACGPSDDEAAGADRFALDPLIAEARATYAPEARSYLEDALDTLARHHVYGPDYDWKELRLAALEHAEGAQAVDSVYPAIRFALRDLDDPHTTFALPPDSAAQAARADASGSSDRPRRRRQAPAMEARIVDGRFVHIDVPRFLGQGAAASQYATALQELIRAYDRDEPCGWIVDLRQNGGGNMWPMLAGLGPLLGDTLVGAFIDRAGTQQPWFYEGGTAGYDTMMRARVEGGVYTLHADQPPVAVLTSEHTASSAEAVVVAFRGRPHTRIFGQATAGAATAPQFFELRDGAWLGFSTLYYADRTGHVYRGPIEPDVHLEKPDWDAPQEPERVVDAAAGWLVEHPVCER